MTPDRATRRKRRRIRLAIRRTSALAAAIAFFFAWGTIGAIETDAVSLVEGTVRTFGLLFIGTGFAFVGGAFRNPTERRSKHEVHCDTVGRPGRTSRHTKNGTTNRWPGTVRDRLRLSDKRCIIEKQTWNSSKPIPNAWALTHLLTSTPSSA